MGQGYFNYEPICSGNRVRRLITCLGLGTTLLLSPVGAQQNFEPGHSIGTVTTQGNLIVMELNQDALGKANLFDLDQSTLRFKPTPAGYKFEKLPLNWDSDFGPEIKGGRVALQNFTFPFSGQKWDSFFVGLGTVTFGSQQNGPSERVGTGFPMARFDQLSVAASTIVNTVPGISVFLKPRMSGKRYAKELPDRAVITWDLTEPWGNIQDFTWKPTVNRFQLVLQKDGTVEMSYNQVAARDAIIGLYPKVDSGKEKLLTTISGETHPQAPPHADIAAVKVSAVDDLFLKISLETRGPALPEGDPGLAGLRYRVYLDLPKTEGNAASAKTERVVWTVRGISRPGRNGAPGNSRYVAFGPGLGRDVKVSGNSIAFQGLLPTPFRNSSKILVSADAAIGENSAAAVSQVPEHSVSLSGIRSPEVHFSSLRPKDGPFPLVYEAFHYLSLPNYRDLSCTVISALGDKFDLLAYYSDFRVDNQEAGTPSNGPMGGHVTGIGQTERGLESYCSAGRFQWGFIQPVYVGSNQMQEYPPADEHTGSTHDVDFYERQLDESTPDGKMLPWNYAMSQIGHEMGHRWSAFVSAKINDELIPLGPTHWARGLQAPAAFPYQRPTEASAMGGGVWQDNFDGTFTQLDDDYYVPATAYSYLDLYLMGLISPDEVPTFFLLKNLVPTGKDSNGHPIFKADRIKVTIDDVIAAEGPRLPAVDQAQKKFNTGMVVVVEHGKKPSNELLERTNAIGKQWIYYWATATGHRATMTTNPQ